MPLKIKNMKGIDFSCASPASTAICSSTDQRYMVKNTTKSFNRLNSYLNDHFKTFTNNIYNTNNNNSSCSPRAPCISELPFTPRLSTSYREKTRKKPPSIVKHSDLTPRRKSSADIADLRRYYEKCSYNGTISPPRGNSSRYLLGESRFLDSLSETHQQNNVTNNKHDAWALVPSTPIVTTTTKEHETKSFGSFLDDEKEKKVNKSLALVNTSDQRVIKSANKSSTQGNNTITKYNEDGHIHHRQKSNLGHSSKNDSMVLKKTSSGTRTRDQVVVLRVSLHCRGCEGKLRKHLSKMEGVTSFSIDLETKKVTVIGNVTPLGVLTSISKVKFAQFWPSAASASPSSSSSSSTSSTLDFN